MAGNPHGAKPQDDDRCSATQVVGGHSLRCGREFGHGGAHNATLDDPADDPDFTYVVSWWPKERS